MSIDEDGGVGAVSEGNVKDGATLRGVDLVTQEHVLNPSSNTALRCQAGRGMRRVDEVRDKVNVNIEQGDQILLGERQRKGIHEESSSPTTPNSIQPREL